MWDDGETLGNRVASAIRRRIGRNRVAGTTELASISTAIECRHVRAKRSERTRRQLVASAEMVISSMRVGVPSTSVVSTSMLTTTDSPGLRVSLPLSSEPLDTDPL